MPTRPRSHEQRQRVKRKRDKHSDQRYDRTVRAMDPALKSAKDVRSSARWQTLRAWKLAQNPLCEDPDRRHVDTPILAKEVDHIVPLTIDLSQAFAVQNLQSLCTHCHGAKSAQERREKG